MEGLTPLLKSFDMATGHAQLIFQFQQQIILIIIIIIIKGAGRVIGHESNSSSQRGLGRKKRPSPSIRFRVNPKLSRITSLFPSLILLFLINLFIFGCIGSSLLRAGFLQLLQAGATLRCGARASHCGGFSCCGAWALGTQASVVVVHGLSCSAAYGNPPGPGLEPVSPALAGRFLTTAPQGKSL